jgi:uroporphyrinogen decarboxylase
VHDLLDAIAAYNLATLARMVETAPDGIFISDDYGLQRSLMMSPSDWREFIKPRLRRLLEAAQARGLVTMLHSCGCVAQIVPDLVELGLDILHPIQPEALDILALKREYGRDLTFCGGIGTQQVLPRGAPEEVRAEVLRVADAMGAGGGYILEPGITLQADVPLENLLALVEAARDYRRYRG